jgi:hypothetical protein
MKKNMGSLDRILRIIVAAVVFYLYSVGKITGMTASILLVLSVVFLLTSIVSFCPLYVPFKMDTTDKK